MRDVFINALPFRKTAGRIAEDEAGIQMMI